ncbi:hypothetical protein EJ08DRAFT_661422 [Tothia fuscella]|uniref:Uncharacterized protein n=1 Tax=Tothia fuscella TaxID=1048955 RepID=A0A9P4TXY6_9PEZI|nr:hypothetical protein EJ08DRAFT_661422 [Tothia fuscella]
MIVIRIDDASCKNDHPSSSCVRVLESYDILMEQRNAGKLMEGRIYQRWAASYLSGHIRNVITAALLTMASTSEQQRMNPFCCKALAGRLLQTVKEELKDLNDKIEMCEKKIENCSIERRALKLEKPIPEGQYQHADQNRLGQAHLDDVEEALEAAELGKDLPGLGAAQVLEIIEHLNAKPDAKVADTSTAGRTSSSYIDDFFKQAAEDRQAFADANKQLQELRNRTIRLRSLLEFAKWGQSDKEPIPDDSKHSDATPYWLVAMTEVIKHADRTTESDRFFLPAINNDTTELEDFVEVDINGQGRHQTGLPLLSPSWDDACEMNTIQCLNCLVRAIPTPKAPWTTDNCRSYKFFWWESPAVTDLRGRFNGAMKGPFLGKMEGTMSGVAKGDRIEGKIRPSGLVGGFKGNIRGLSDGTLEINGAIMGENPPYENFGVLKDFSGNFDGVLGRGSHSKDGGELQGQLFGQLNGTLRAV